MTRLEVGLDRRIGFLRRFRSAPEVQNGHQIAAVVSQVDTVLERIGAPRVAGYRGVKCGLTADLVKRAAEIQGMRSDILQVSNVHESLGGNKRDAFLHAFSLTRNGTNAFLVDPSFCQFLDSQDNRIVCASAEEDASAYGDLVSGTTSDHPIALDLLRRGYVELTQDSLRAYLRATTAGDKAYIDGVRVEDVLGNPSFTLDYMDAVEELDDYLAGRKVPQDDY